MPGRFCAGILLTALAVLLPWAGAGYAHAQQPISGNFAPGNFTGMKGALTPPPGKFILENGTLVYWTRDFVDSSGDALPTDPVNVIANRTLFGYVTGWKILGGDYFPAVVFPLANVAMRPEPGSEKDFQLGDLILQLVGLGWHYGALHPQFTYTLWLPTARFNAGASDNVGKGLFSHLLSGGLTWLQERDKPWAATLMIRYEILGRQRDTEILPGNVLILEGGAGKEIFTGFDLGLTYHFTTQTTEEEGSPPNTDTSRYGFAGLGPEFNWRPTFLPGFQLAVRSYFEVTARNTSQGVFAVFSLAYLFPSGS